MRTQMTKKTHPSIWSRVCSLGDTVPSARVLRARQPYAQVMSDQKCWWGSVSLHLSWQWNKVMEKGGKKSYHTEGKLKCLVGSEAGFDAETGRRAPSCSLEENGINWWMTKPFHLIAPLLMKHIYCFSQSNRSNTTQIKLEWTNSQLPKANYELYFSSAGSTHLD